MSQINKLELESIALVQCCG